MTRIDPEVIVIGDGPAGSALAQACTRLGVPTTLIGDDAPWKNTYGVWVDELVRASILGADPSAFIGSQHGEIVAWTNRRHDLNRTYGVIANEPLRDALRNDVMHVNARVSTVRVEGSGNLVELESGESLTARLVVDCTGWPATFASRTVGSTGTAWQTAFGVVLDEPPAGDLGVPTLMDFRPAANSTQSTFAYSLPVADGWLVEETVLAGRPAVEPVALIPVLAARLRREPDELLDAAKRTEYVTIPMGGPRPRRDQPIVAFGAAAGYVNPISGYSLVASMQAAPDVAAQIANELSSAGPVDTIAVWNSVWPVGQRRSRVLHDYGLDMLMRLDADTMRGFFESFFDLPTERWAAYLAPSSPLELSGVMTELFRSASWSTRRRLVAGNPAAFARLVRPS